MTQKQRERLVYINGMLSGLQWCVESESVADALQSVQNDINELLNDDEEKTAEAPKPEPKTAKSVQRCCKNCKFETLLPDAYPCDECWYGNGSCLDVNYWEAKTDGGKTDGRKTD